MTNSHQNQPASAKTPRRRRTFTQQINTVRPGGNIGLGDQTTINLNPRPIKKTRRRPEKCSKVTMDFNIKTFVA